MSISVLSSLNHSVILLLRLFFLGVIYNLYLFVSSIHKKYTTVIQDLMISNIYPVLQVLYCNFGAFICLDIFHVYCCKFH